MIPEGEHKTITSRDLVSRAQFAMVDGQDLIQLYRTLLRLTVSLPLSPARRASMKFSIMESTMAPLPGFSNGRIEFNQKKDMIQRKASISFDQYSDAVRKANASMKANNGHSFVHLRKARCEWCGRSPTSKGHCREWFRTFIAYLARELTDTADVPEEL